VSDELGMDLAGIFVNAVLPERFSGAEAEAMASVDGAGSPAAREAVAAALTAHERAKAQRSQVGRLKRGAQAPVATLPFLLSPELVLDDLEELSQELERKL
jgi:hypothetical protein